MLEPRSIPFCVHRNLRSTFPTIGIFNSKKELYTKAKLDAEYCLEHIEHGIPPELLSRILFEDSQSFQTDVRDELLKSRSSLLHVKHHNTSAILMCGGKNMEDIIMRPIETLKSYLPSQTLPGFSISNGSSIKNLLELGSSPMIASTNVIAQSEYDITLYQTTFINAESDFKSEVRNQSIYNAQILEPMYKYTVPSEISCITAAHFEAQLITTNNMYYSLDVEYGLHKFLDAPLFEARKNQRVCIESSEHPCIKYVSNNKTFFIMDQRKKQLQKLFKAETPLTCLKYCNSQSRMCYVSHMNALAVLDVRYPTSYVSSTVSPGYYTTLTSVSTPIDATEVLIGFSKLSRQIMTHTIALESNNRIGPFRSPSDTFFNSVNPFGNTTVGWNVSGFPVVDRSTIGSELLGALLLPQPTSRHEYLLVQQSSMGDVFAQELDLLTTDSPRAPIQRGLPIGVRCYPDKPRRTRSGKSKKYDFPGLRLLRPIAKQDLIRNAYPLSSGRFMPFIEKACRSDPEIFHLQPFDFQKQIEVDRGVSATYYLKKSGKYGLNSGKTTDDFHDSLERLSLQLQRKLNEISSMSLHEIWLFVNQDFKLCIDPRKLRVVILGIENITEALMNDPTTSIPSSDGITMVPREALSSRCCSCIANKEAIMICDSQECLIPHLLRYSLESIILESNEKKATFLTPSTAPFVEIKSLTGSDVSTKHIQDLQFKWIL